jgi:hypothetical protein
MTPEDEEFARIDAEIKRRQPVPVKTYSDFKPWPVAPVPDGPYSAPIKELWPVAPKPWVGLSEDEISKLRHLVDWTAEWSYGRFAYELERLLREKNARPQPAAPEFYHHVVENEGDWSEWVNPDNDSYMMKCCDCGLVHEMQFKVAKYSDGDECEFVGDPDLQPVFRARRAEEAWQETDTPPTPQPVPVKTYSDGKPWPVQPAPDPAPIIQQLVTALEGSGTRMRSDQWYVEIEAVAAGKFYLNSKGANHD